MRKVIIFLLAMMLSVNAYAGIISYDQIASYGSLTVAKYNADLNTVYGEVNGNLTTLNLASNTITDGNMAAAVKPSNFLYESLGDYTYSGHLPATDASLTSDISAGTSYVRGKRCATSATSHTYTATKDTWVYIDSNSTFQYQEVAVGAAQPSDPSNSLLLAKVTTSAAAITAVLDRRQLAPPNLRTYLNYRQGCIVSYDTNATIKVISGDIELGTNAAAGLRRNTTALTLTWADLDTGAEAGSTLYYVHAYPDSSNASNFAGKISASTTPTGVSYSRMIGWFYNDAGSNVSPDSVGCYKGDGSGVPNTAQTEQSMSVALGSTLAELASVKVYASGGRPLLINYCVAGKASGNEYGHIAISDDSVTLADSGRDVILNATTAANASGVYILKPGSAGLRTIRLKAVCTSGGTWTADRATIIVNEL